MNISCTLPRSGPHVVVYLTPEEREFIDPHRTGRANIRVNATSRTIDVMTYTDTRDSSIRNYAIGPERGRWHRIQFSLPPGTIAQFAPKSDATILFSGKGIFSVDASSFMIVDKPTIDAVTVDTAVVETKANSLVELDDTQTAMAETMIGTLRELVERRMLTLRFDENGLLRGRVNRRVVQTVDI